MELHKAIKEIVASKGAGIINNIQIINFLLDFQAFKEKPATKLILRDVINAGYAESILALQNTQGWQIKFKQYEHEFIDSCGYKEELTVYVFESIAYALGLNDGGNEEPAIKPSFNVDSFFDIPEVQTQQPSNTLQNSNKQNPDPTDLYTIALSFYNEGKYLQAKGFIEKAINTQPNSSIPSNHLRLLGDILMRIGDYEEAIKCYNECFTQKAKEEKCTIDQLRESFKQHKVKDYENIIFCYFFCLYSVKRMNDAQWLQFVKGEARSGLMDAIRYCADNGINPIEDHIDIYFVERSNLKNNDYLYSDGSFSHEYSATKKAIAKIILMETSDYEKSKGWNHGYIIPLHGREYDVKERKFRFFPNILNSVEWSKEKKDLPFPHSHYTEDDLNHWDDIPKIESEFLISIQDISLYPVFSEVINFEKIPIFNTSKWFVPSIHHIKKFVIGSSSFLRLYGDYIGNYMGYWTSSQADINNAISFHPRYESGRYGKGYYETFELEDKSTKNLVLPIAAF